MPLLDSHILHDDHLTLAACAVAAGTNDQGRDDMLRAILVSISCLDRRDAALAVIRRFRVKACAFAALASAGRAVTLGTGSGMCRFRAAIRAGRWRRTDDRTLSKGNREARSGWNQEARR